MDARTQRRLRRERERELPNLAEDILNLLPKKLIENNDFASLKNKLMENIQNGNNEKWIGTKFFTVLSVIKDWNDDKECGLTGNAEPAEMQRRWDDYEEVVPWEGYYCLPGSCFSKFKNNDRKLIYKSYLFQKKLNELYPNKFTLSNKTEYKKLWNELEDLFEYVDDILSRDSFPGWMDGYNQYWNSGEQNYTVICDNVIKEFWDKHLLDLMPDDYCGYKGRKWIANGGYREWLVEVEKSLGGNSFSITSLWKDGLSYIKKIGKK